MGPVRKGWQVLGARFPWGWEGYRLTAENIHMSPCCPLRGLLQWHGSSLLGVCSRERQTCHRRRIQNVHDLSSHTSQTQGTHLRANRGHSTGGTSPGAVVTQQDGEASATKAGRERPACFSSIKTRSGRKQSACSWGPGLQRLLGFPSAQQP